MLPISYEPAGKCPASRNSVVVGGIASIPVIRRDREYGRIALIILVAIFHVPEAVPGRDGVILEQDDKVGMLESMFESKIGISPGAKLFPVDGQGRFDEIDGLGEVIGHAGPNTKIIPGHGPNVDRNAVVAHRDMAIAVRDRVAALVAQGKSEDEVVAAKVTADLDSKVQEVGMTADRFVRQVYAELKAR